MVNSWTEDWPEEPGNDELARFADELAAVLPTLSAESLQRTENALWTELAARERRRRQALARHIGLAAAVLLGLAFGLIVFVPGSGKLHVPVDPSVRVRPVPVEDHFEVDGSISGVGSLPGRPLVSVDDHRSLFMQGGELLDRRAGHALSPSDVVRRDSANPRTAVRGLGAEHLE